MRFSLVFFNKKIEVPKKGGLFGINFNLFNSKIFNHQHNARLYCNTPQEYKYITTPIFYVNSLPHIGHLYTGVLADCIARFNMMQGQITMLTTGTDEHGIKVENAARLVHLPTDEYCSSVSEKFKEMCDLFDINYSDFIRTTESRHHKAVNYFWNLLADKGHIYKGKYSGWYCISEEAFLSNEQLIEHKAPDGELIKVSSESGHSVQWAEEDNYKFRLSSFKSDLQYWLKDENVVRPSIFHKMLSQWIEEESFMSDLSISRPQHRVPWGIPVPNDSSQTIYVWFDALINYLTSLGYPDPKYKNFWPPDVQVIGKDILKFHGIYWPAFLIAAGLEPPKSLFCHSHWTIDNQKMSKSRGNVINPKEAAAQFMPDGLRYFLLRDSVPEHNANYSTARVQNVLNSELADNLGNLISRCTGKAINPKKIIPSVYKYHKILTSEAANTLRNDLENLGNSAEKNYNSYKIHHAVDDVMAAVKCANIMIEFHKPWELRKLPNDPIVKMELLAVLSLALETCRISALCLTPVVPLLCSGLLDFLNVPLNERNWVDTRPKYLEPIPVIKDEHFQHENIVLFPKLKISV